ncbi:MAG: hypothetical protein FJ213_01370 [Ignavibacteria bacterium]|nr:hypothetical protein [Ignavibacteria bacterium]
MEILSAIEPVIKAFEELGISYYIGGSIASSAYGIARATLDVDLISNLKPYQVNSLVKKLKPDYFIDENMIQDAIQTTSSFNLIHLETMLKVDVFILKEKLYSQKAFERKRKDTIDVENNSLQIYLCSAEDIILNKLEWYKLGEKVSERQWLDVLGVIKVQGNLLDVEYLKHWAKELDISDLLERALEEGKG